MADLEEQRRKVEELKKKILEQKTKGTVVSAVQEMPSSTAVETKIISPSTPSGSKKIEATPHAEDTSQSIQQTVRSEKQKEEPPAQRHAPAVIALQAYAQVLKQAWSDGVVSKDEEAILLILRQTFDITSEEHESLERELQAEVYTHVLTAAWQDGLISTEDSERLEFFRNKFHISADEHFRLEKQVREKLMRTK